MLFRSGLGIENIPKRFLHKSSQKSTLELLCFSRIALKKRLDLCIIATRKLLDLGIDVKLTIAGTGDFQLMSQLINLIDNLKIKHSVEFLGFIDGDQKHLCFQKSDIFLLPSENENFAVAVAEAISYQVPVVVSKNVAMKDFVLAQGVGEVIDDLEVSELVSKILKIKESYLRYWDNCRKSKNLLSWDEVLKIWERELKVRSSDFEED